MKLLTILLIVAPYLNRRVISTKVNLLLRSLILSSLHIPYRPWNFGRRVEEPPPTPLTPSLDARLMIYPELSPKLIVPLEVIREQLRIDPGYLSHPNCPYDARTKALLRLMAPTPTVDDASGDLFLGRTGSKAEILVKEVQEAYLELKEFSGEITDLDVSEKMSYFRTRASLLEKLVGLIERTNTLADVTIFQDTVISLMEEMLTPQQHEEFLQRLNTDRP